MGFQPSSQRTKAVVIPAPVGGINALSNLMGMSPENCIAAVNYVPQTNGMEIRRGYAPIAYSFTGVSDGVRTLIPFEGTTSAKDKLFACTQEGIYDTSAALDQAWSSKTGDAGYVTYAIYTTIATKVLLVADIVNGLLSYDENTDAWTVPTFTGDLDTDGLDATDIAFVTVWKQRIWLIPRDSSTAYFLEAGTIAGGTTRIEFGNKFLSGGFLHSIHNFTMDGGMGPDDYLVALSSAGDVVAYQGTDPTNIETFDIIGVWNIGHLPAGRTLTTSSGGDLYILCSQGLVSLTQILKGTDPGAIPAYITGKITPLVRLDIATYLDSRGWGVYNHPTESLLIITTPSERQYAMNTTTRAWTTLSGLPMHCAATWKSRLYMGGEGLSTYEGDVDDEDPINSFLLTVFAGEGANARLHFIKPQFLARGLPLYEVEARYDFDISAYVRTLTGTIPEGAGSTWSDTWGTASWGDASQFPLSETRGASGMGKFVAIALTSRSNEQATLVGFTAMGDSGGFL